MSSLTLNLDIVELAWDNLLNDDHAETIAKAYPSHTLEVEYILEPGRPARIRADPNDSHPEELSDVEIMLDVKEEAGNIAVAIIVALPRGATSKMTDSLLHFRIGLEDYLDNWQNNVAPDLALAKEQDMAIEKQ